MRALADAGVFRLGGILVGSYAFQILGNLLGVAWPMWSTNLTLLVLTQADIWIVGKFHQMNCCVLVTQLSQSVSRTRANCYIRIG